MDNMMSTLDSVPASFKESPGEPILHQSFVSRQIIHISLHFILCEGHIHILEVAIRSMEDLPIDVNIARGAFFSNVNEVLEHNIFLQSMLGNLAIVVFTAVDEDFPSSMIDP